MREHGLTNVHISKHAGVDYDMARRAMLPHEVHRVRHGAIVRVRASVETLLRTFGWKGSPARLWAEYDDPLKTVPDEQDAA